jgi:hypothetical protein
VCGQWSPGQHLGACATEGGNNHNIRCGARIEIIGLGWPGWRALKWQETINTDMVLFGRHAQLRYLAKKVANFLYEYHCDLFPTLGQPVLPSDSSRVDVHAIMDQWHIAQLLERLTVS